MACPKGCVFPNGMAVVPVGCGFCHRLGADMWLGACGHHACSGCRARHRNACAICTLPVLLWQRDRDLNELISLSQSSADANDAHMTDGAD